MSDPVAAQYVDGVGFHWYNEVDDLIPGFFYVNNVHEDHPQIFLLATEASAGAIPNQFGIESLVGPQGPFPGDWTRGAVYGHDILQDLENWSVGWTDWNIVLNPAGGPNWIGNFVDAPIITDATSNSTFHVQPMYYHLGHFSAFIPPGSVRIHLIQDLPAAVELTAWETPCGDLVIVALNQDLFPILGNRSYDIYVPERGWININMPPGSIQTIVFKGYRS
jgi:glucosylceramidase